jgi:flagellar motor switch protein FliM
MPTDEILTQDEMDALREVVAQRKVSLPYRAAPLEDAQPYELISPETNVSGILPVLETIQERFAHRLRIGLFELLRREVEVVGSSIEIRAYNDLITALSAPCSINIIGISPLSGPGLLMFERQLVFMVVDTFFGGTGRMYTTSPTRDFTPTETRFIQRLLKLTFHCLEAAWQPFTPINCVSLSVETNPQFVTAINPLEALAVTSLQIQKEDSTGNLYLALPCSMFEPVRGVLLASLNKEHPRYSERLTRLLQDGVKDSLVDIRCTLAETELSFRDLLLLKVGDFIPMDISDEALIEIEGIPLYKGQYGVAQGWRALKIKRPLTSLGSAHISPNTEDTKP